MRDRQLTPVPTLDDGLRLPCGVRLENRIAKAALSEQLGDRHNAPTPRLAQLYRRWAEGGAGLLVTGNVMVDPGAIGEPANVVVEDERHLPELERWAAAAEGTAAAIWMQVNHPGRQSPRHLSPHPVAPSAVAMGGSRRGAFAPPRALEESEIVEIVGRFAATAGIARRAGFAGVQVHGAHGYLVSQFLSPRTNLRDDAWGGDPQRRMRFLVEVVRAVRAAVGPGFPIGVKLNSADFQRGGFDEEASVEVARVLQREGIDLLEVSGGTYERAVMVGGRAPSPQRDSTVRREAYFLDYTRRLREATQLPLMLTGGFRSGNAMREALSAGDVDVIGLGRPLTVEPDLPRALLAGAAARSTVRPIRTRVRALDGISEIAWHTQQMHLLAAGRKPAPGRTVVRALGQALLTNGRDTFRRTRG